MEENIIRRENLIELLEENSVAVLFAGAPKIASEDEYYPFQSNRHFYYLTNIEQEISFQLEERLLTSISTPG